MANQISGQQVAQLGHDFAALSPQFLMEQIERQYTAPELLQFTESAASSFMALYYVNFRNAFGKEAAEAWIKKVLSLCSSSVRVMGGEALLKFDVQIKEMPNKLKKDVQIVEPQELPKEPKCACKLFADGSCPICIGKLSSVLKGTFKLMRDIGQYGKRLIESCPICAVTQTDRALVKMVPDLLEMKKNIPDENKEAFDQEALASLHQLGSMAGAMEIPLTEKAWLDAVQEEAS